MIKSNRIGGEDAMVSDALQLTEFSKYPSPKSIGLSRNQIDLLAEQAFDDLQLKPGFSIDSVIQDQLHGRIMVDRAPADGSYIIVRGKSDFDIHMRGGLGHLSGRLNLSHELAHYFLHASSPDYQLFAGESLEDTQDKQAEREANWFAHGFLMPRTQFSKKHKETNGSISELSFEFDVSISAVESRIAYLEL